MSIDQSTMTQTINPPGAVMPPKGPDIAAIAAKMGNPATSDTSPKPDVTQAPADPAKPVVSAAAAASATASDTTPPAEETKINPMANSFAMLARREQGLVKRQDELRSKEMDLVEREKKLGNFSQLEESRKKEVAENPLKALEYFGLTYEQLTNFILKGGLPAEKNLAKVIDEKFDSWKKQQDEERQSVTQKQAQEAAQKAQADHEAVIKQFHSDVGAFVTEKASEYELINLYGATPVVISTIEEHFEKTGKILDFKEAADLVEKYYEDEALKATQTNKLKARVNPPEPKVEPKQTSPAQPRTLNNNMTATVPSLMSSASSERERMQRALAALS